jgi:hypothetical protein
VNEVSSLRGKVWSYFSSLSYYFNSVIKWDSGFSSENLCFNEETARVLSSTCRECCVLQCHRGFPEGQAPVWLYHLFLSDLRKVN